jgi:hypothetical protein
VYFFLQDLSKKKTLSIPACASCRFFYILDDNFDQLNGVLAADNNICHQYKNDIRHYSLVQSNHPCIWALNEAFGQGSRLATRQLSLGPSHNATKLSPDRLGWSGIALCGWKGVPAVFPNL